jgi:hypothetical protein
VHDRDAVCVTVAHREYDQGLHAVPLGQRVALAQPRRRGVAVGQRVALAQPWRRGVAVGQRVALAQRRRRGVAVEKRLAGELAVALFDGLLLPDEPVSAGGGDVPG